VILAGDVGGTKTNLAWFEARGRGLIGPAKGGRSFRSGDYPSLGALVSAFRSEEPGALDAACFGVAGAVVNGSVTGPNLPWPIEERTLAADLGIPRVHLINDLAATGYGVPVLPPDALHPLQRGQEAEDAAVALIAAGTGLGETILIRRDGDLVPIPSEGGHADFAPRTDREVAVFHALRERFGRVSYERVLSGPGLVHVAEVMHEQAGASALWKKHLEEVGDGDLAEGVSGRALGRDCAPCGTAMDVFVGVYGAEAGNMAVRGLTRGGVYLGGGIAPKILPALASPRFLEAFRKKDHLEPLLRTIPVQVILEQRTAMLGAARYAALVRA
jgi:glucokinase